MSNLLSLVFVKTKCIYLSIFLKNVSLITNFETINRDGKRRDGTDFKRDLTKITLKLT